MSDAYDIYAKRLFELKHGLPLYEPDPAGGYDKVRIGDVGYVQRGHFFRVFNVYEPESNQIINCYGVPNDFENLKLGTNGITYSTQHPIGVYHCSHVHDVDGKAGVSGCVLPYHITLSARA